MLLSLCWSCVSHIVLVLTTHAWCCCCCSQASVLHYGSISLITEPCRSAHLAALNIAKEAGVLLSYDPNLRLPLWPSPEAAREGIKSIWNDADIIKVPFDLQARCTQCRVCLCVGGCFVASVVIPCRPIPSGHFWLRFSVQSCMHWSVKRMAWLADGNPTCCDGTCIGERGRSGFFDGRQRSLQR